MLSMVNIYKTYNAGSTEENCLFTDFNLKIENGEFVTVVGSNGSGKTSMLNIICGGIPIDKGQIILQGREFTSLPEYKRASSIGRVYQNPAVGACPHMTVLENLSIADNKNRPFNLTAGVNKKRISFYKEQLETLGLGLEDKLSMQVGLMSGGQRQALALLMSVMAQIDFLILDEHTAALDPKTSENIMKLTDEIVRRKRITTIMVTHNLRHAVDYGSRLIMMHDGRIVLDLKGNEKLNTKTEDLLQIFAKISVELGN